MILLEQWGMPLAVVSLLLATLCLAALLGRYRGHQARTRSAACRVEALVLAITRAMDALQGVPLSRELRVTLRTEVLAGYQRLRRYYRRYPAIGDRIRAAETAIDAEGRPASGGVGPIEDEQAFLRLLSALDDLDRVIAQGATLCPIPHDVRAIFRRELGERRAEVFARYYMVGSRRLGDLGRSARARAQLTTLMRVLRERGPATGFVRALYKEAAAAAAALDGRGPIDRSPDGRGGDARNGSTSLLGI